MTKQPSKVRNALANLKRGGIILPESRNPQQCWLLVVMHPQDNNKGEVFITHARNFPKFNARRGFEVVAHSFDKDAIQQAQRRLTLRLGEAYQPKFSAHATKRGPTESPDPTRDYDEAPEQPEDLHDVIGTNKPTSGE